MTFQSDNKHNLGFYGVSELVQAVPSLITLLRIVVLPHLIYSFKHGLTPFVYVLFLFAIGTDMVDGYLARKFSVQSKLGAYLDVTVDFIFIFGMYLVFTINQFYPPLILLIISAIFAQFIITNLYSKQTIYDPVGKYYGSILFAGIGLTLLFPDPIVYCVVTLGIISSTAVSILSRTLYFLRTKPQLL